MAIEPRFEMTISGAQDVLVIRGDIDASTSPQLRDLLTGLMDEGHYRLVVDLEAVGFMDSTGLGVLASCLKRAKEHDGDLSLICTSPQILRVLSNTGLDKMFEVRVSLDDGTA